MFINQIQNINHVILKRTVVLFICFLSFALYSLQAEVNILNTVPVYYNLENNPDVDLFYMDSLKNKNRILPSGEGVELNMPYSDITLNMEYVDPALSDPYTAILYETIQPRVEM